MFHTIISTLAAAPIVPSPGGGAAPPGASQFTKLLQWALWFGMAVCVAGVIKAGASMAMAGSGRSGGGMHEHGLGLALALVGAILCGGAAAIVGAISG